MADQPSLAQRLGIDGLRGVEPAGVDRRLHPAEIDHRVLTAEHVVEATLGQTHMERHLAALETLDAHAGAGGLALAAAPGSLALAGADAAADADSRLARARIVGELIQLHDPVILCCGCGQRPRRASPSL